MNTAWLTSGVGGDHAAGRTHTNPGFEPDEQQQIGDNEAKVSENGISINNSPATKNINVDNHSAKSAKLPTTNAFIRNVARVQHEAKRGSALLDRPAEQNQADERLNELADGSEPQMSHDDVASENGLHSLTVPSTVTAEATVMASAHLSLPELVNKTVLAKRYVNKVKRFSENSLVQRQVFVDAILVIVLVLFSVFGAAIFLGMKCLCLSNAEATNCNQDNVTFWVALHYVNNLHSSIGFGNVSPLGQACKAVTCVYTIIGIPLCLLILNHLGELLMVGANEIWVYGKYVVLQRRVTGFRSYRNSNRLRSGRRLGGGKGSSDRSSGSSSDDGSEIELPLYIALLMMTVSVGVSAAYFKFIFKSAPMAGSEDMDSNGMLDAIYFTIMSITTVGLGDLAPALFEMTVISWTFIFIGLALLSMTWKLFQVKIERRMKDMMENVQHRIQHALSVGDGASANDDPLRKVSVAAGKRRVEPSNRSRAASATAVDDDDDENEESQSGQGTSAEKGPEGGKSEMKRAAEHRTGNLKYLVQSMGKSNWVTPFMGARHLHQLAEMAAATSVASLSDDGVDRRHHYSSEGRRSPSPAETEDDGSHPRHRHHRNNQLSTTLVAASNALLENRSISMRHSLRLDVERPVFVEEEEIDDDQMANDGDDVDDGFGDGEFEGFGEEYFYRYPSDREVELESKGTQTDISMIQF